MNSDQDLFMSLSKSINAVQANQYNINLNEHRQQSMNNMQSMNMIQPMQMSGNFSNQFNNYPSMNRADNMRSHTQSNPNISRQTNEIQQPQQSQKQLTGIELKKKQLRDKQREIAQQQFLKSTHDLTEKPKNPKFLPKEKPSKPTAEKIIGTANNVYEIPKSLYKVRNAIQQKSQRYFDNTQPLYQQQVDWEQITTYLLTDISDEQIQQIENVLKLKYDLEYQDEV
ncbi:Hypothetical_protein [Hexamita inflata]|uniref:Hypothetical_protein n=1 Tax=Hexamita inflata TaxID=28002 RepID=A0AA86NC36_9EUKA|nr:Hypothetical protein HINF_LOCUS4360 [Hexamita inflata]